MDDLLSPTDQALAVRLRQQELVASFGLFALRTHDLDDLFDQACDICARGLQTEFAKVMEYRTETQDFLLRNGVGWRPGVVRHAVLGSDLASPAGFALRSRMPVVSNHLGREARFSMPAILAEHGVQRAINVIVEGTDGVGIPFGVLEADSSGRQSFTVHDVAFMQVMANVLSAAIARHRQQVRLEQLVREKEVLVQEVHHRIKNNLQLVQTMLHLQARAVEDEGERGRLNEAAGRIMSIATLHRRLHEEGAVETVALGPYIEGLIEELQTSLTPADQSRPITLVAEAASVAAAHAPPVGLIVVELITNALKYGAGPIEVRLAITPRGVDITVSDEGPGFPPGFDPAVAGNLGLRLMAALARTPGAISVSRVDNRSVVTVGVTFSTY